MKPCNHDEHNPKCRICYWYASLTQKGESYRRLWSKQDNEENQQLQPQLTKPLPSIPRTTHRRFPDYLLCIHKGEITGETRECQTCNKKVDVPLISCSIHTVCTERNLVPGVQCCRICKDCSPAKQPLTEEVKQ